MTLVLVADARQRVDVWVVEERLVATPRVVLDAVAHVRVVDELGPRLVVLLFVTDVGVDDSCHERGHDDKDRDLLPLITASYNKKCDVAQITQYSRCYAPAACSMSCTK